MDKVNKLKKELYRMVGLGIKGVAASPGIAIGNACVIRKNKIAATGILLKNEHEVLAETKKFETAVQASVDEVEAIINNDGQGLNDDEIDILETHIEFLTDPQIKADVVENITKYRKNAVDAVIDAIHKAVQLFENMNDEYMSARAADVQDIGNRIIKNLHQSLHEDLQKLEANTILIAEDIAPSDAITIDMHRVVGFATQMGGKTSHTAILAKSKNLPAVLGCGDVLNNIENKDIIIVDGSQGVVIINPDENCLNEYKVKQEAQSQQLEFLRSLKDVPAQTSDGVAIKLLANISNADDMEESLAYGAEGVGLFRTELLFMYWQSFPSEEDQFEFYKEVALKSKGKPVIVRTIDIGGDKPLDYFRFPEEENPFLGYRGIRICLDRKDIFITQLKAILRAGIFGNLAIMFPMISNVQELRQAREILEEAKKELQENNAAFDKDIPVGMMIEVPSAAIIADILAKEVDFFSIGTNDLCQYTLAADRLNEKIKDLYDLFNPAVLRLIKYVIEQAHQHNIKVGMCGELASDPLATLLLLGMGLEEFSMSAASIPSIKNILMNHSYAKAKEVCEKAMAMDTSKSIIEYLQSQQ